MKIPTGVAAALAAIVFLGTTALAAATEEEAEQQEPAAPAVQPGMPQQEPAAPAVLPGMPPQEPLAYRKHVKNAMQSHLSAFGLILMFRVPYDNQFAMHADALAALAEAHKSLYPEGSGGPNSSPLIWQEPEAFATAATKTSVAAANLKKSVDTKNRHAILNAATRFSESCESCHVKFRTGEK